MLLHKRNLDITEEDHLVLLITCTSEMTNGRNILVGRLTEQIYPEQENRKLGDWDRPDTKTGHIRADSFLALVASSYLIVTRSKN